MTPNRGQSEDPSRASIDLRDPMQVAVRLMEAEGDIRLVQQQVQLGLKSLFDQLASVQGDLRDLDRSVHGIAEKTHEIQSHSTGLDRLAQSIERHVAQQDQWRRSHEAENKAVSDRVTMWRGMVLGFGLVATLLASAAIYIVQKGFDDAAKERVRIDARLDRLETRP